MDLDFRLLGGIEAWIDGRKADIGHLRQRYVLVALLVDANRAVPLDQLADRVWNTPRPRARSTLHSYISRLRQALALPIVRRPDGYVLEIDPVTVDLHRFRQLVDRARASRSDEEMAALLKQALGLWRGEAFVGMDTPWITALRAAAEQERIAAERDHVDVSLRLGRHAEVLADLLREAPAYPLDERLQGQLILALHRSGRQAEALQHYQRTRRQLTEQLGIDPGPELRELHQQILTADPALVLDSGPPRSVPRQLPAPPALFTGRERELSQLDSLVRDRDGRPVLISAIGGIGGIGKTSLALHWAHRNAGRFPDGQLYVNLRGFDPAGTPTPPAIAVRGLIGALQDDTHAIPADLDARTALYRSLIAGRRMLVVLDNAHDTEQVLPLLPGDPACAVLITSRRKLTGLIATHAAVPVDLSVFTADEASELLTRHLGGRVQSEPVTFGQIIEQCAGLPLAIAIVAAIANSNTNTPLSDLATRLRDTRTRLDTLNAGERTANLRVALSSSYEALEAETAQLFALTALAPGPDIGLPGVASLMGWPLDEALRRLRQLENAHLIDRQAADRYRMHDLVRLYAEELASRDVPEPARIAALRRAVDHYLHTAHAAERTLNPHSQPITLAPAAAGTVVLQHEDEASALMWLDAEYPNIIAAQHLAAGQGRHAEVWQLAWSLSSRQTRRAEIEDQIVTWETALTSAHELNDPTVEALVHRILGHATMRAGRPEAVGHLERALALSGADMMARAFTHHALAHALEKQDKDAEALTHATAAFHLFQSLDNEIWQAEALNWRGWLHTKLGHHDVARAHGEDALALHRKLHDKEGEANALDSLGHNAHRSGRYAEAVRHYEDALVLFRELGDAYEEANTLVRMGKSFSAMGDFSQARAALQDALRLFRLQHRTKEAAMAHADLERMPGA
jgi:DNA-binding SARP family transcriptional activator/tetratricopeptide (TPR) repeat protein